MLSIQPFDCFGTLKLIAVQTQVELLLTMLNSQTGEVDKLTPADCLVDNTL